MNEEIELDEISKKIFSESLAAVEKRIYFRIIKGAEGCPSDKPYGVVGEKSGVVHGCHSTQASAAKQLRSIYAATDPKNGYKPASKETKKDMETPKQHDKRRAREMKKEGKMSKASEMLTPRQEFMYGAYEAAVQTFGHFNQGSGPDGAHYGPGEKNPFKADGLVCENCAFYEGGACEIVEGQIDPQGICKLWIIEESELNDEMPESEEDPMEDSVKSIPGLAPQGMPENPMPKEGDYVSFELDGQMMIGTVEYVMTDGAFGIQGSEYYAPASKENPLALIRIWEDGEETELLTGRPVSEIKVTGAPPMDQEESAEMFAIPDRVRKNAQRGLELRKKFGRGGTDVGENTARTLAGGGSIGIEKIKHINRYFPRHAGDNLSDKTSNGWIAWLLWGGDAAWSWTRRIVRSYEARDGARMFTQERRMKLAKEGIAMPDGSYPIVSINDLKNAIQAYGRAKDLEATKKHIIKRAKSLNAEDMLPEGWL
jgi:hypothetical protein